MKRIATIPLLSLVVLLAAAPAVSAQTYILLGWNDLGMHCSNKDFSKIAVLPPYNNVSAQLIMKTETGPKLVTNGFTVSYSIPGNTYSVGKTNFWTYAKQLFGLSAALPSNIGLTGNGLAGTMQPTTDGFIATGIPVTPYTDANLTTEAPYQLIHLTARNTATNAIVAETDAVIPVSNEISCAKSGCHTSEQAIKNQHPSVNGLFKYTQPVLCASCHASNALGTTGMSSARSLSYRIHEKHKDIIDKSATTTASKLAACYSCHPGPNTKCFRDVMRSKGMVCQDCHGTMQTISESISNGRRPWLDEPKCGGCHTNTYGEETGKLYRQSKGHGGLACSACHGSPHAIQPTAQPNDNLQNLRLQGTAGVLAKCGVCHPANKTGIGPHGVVYKEGVATTPAGFELGEAYPNPVHGGASQVVIEYRLPEDAAVTIDVYDLTGALVAPAVRGSQAAGLHSATVDLSSLRPGMYFYTMHTGAFSATRKLVVIR